MRLQLLLDSHTAVVSVAPVDVNKWISLSYLLLNQSPSGDAHLLALCLCGQTTLWRCLCLRRSGRMCTAAYERGSRIRESEARHFFFFVVVYVVIASRWWTRVCTAAWEMLAAPLGQGPAEQPVGASAAHGAGGSRSGRKSSLLCLIKSALKQPSLRTAKVYPARIAESLFLHKHGQVRGKSSSRGREAFL